MIKPVCRHLLLLLGALQLFACSVMEVRDGAPKHGSLDNVPPAVPRAEPLSRYGNPHSYEVDGITYRVLKTAKGYREKGIASWYGTKFHGRRTSSGEPYDMFKMTAAHKTLPLPSYVRVTNLDNGKSVVVRVNDRGPFKPGRIIDLSYAAAHKLDMHQQGTARVEVVAIDTGRAASSGHQGDLKPDSAGRYRFVQVGAYAKYRTAQKLAKVLDREIDLPVKITSVRVRGKKLYRVRIGPIDDLGTAERLVAALDIKELGKPRIIYED